VEAVINQVRSEMEQCDYFGGFLLLQSLAGGTGAGLGSRVAEEMNESFPSALQLSYAVWPYDTGEVLVQAYNTLLSVNKLLETCDGVIITRNEDLAATCSVRSPPNIESTACISLHPELCADICAGCA
jgi:tubulin delta